MKAVGLRSFTHFTMQKNELVEKIRLSIEDSSTTLWLPNLTADLAKIGWRTLKNDIGSTSSNYGTARILTGNINAPLSIIPFKDKIGNTSFSIELLPKEITDNYTDSQIDFYNAAELTKQPVLDCLTEAIELIKTVQELYKSVFPLTRSIHLIKLTDDNYDVSFSEPQLPFSIFVSIPKKRIKADFLRVAEAIVHEAMHLRLSLIEKIAPLINSNEQEFYSPWKDEYRNSTGILHALYVFKIIETFYRYLEMKQHFSGSDLEFIKNRRNKILLQIKGVNEFSRSCDLTEIGLLLTNRLMG